VFLQPVEPCVNRGLPKEQLLDYKIGSGWEPLCTVRTISEPTFERTDCDRIQFLDKPIPSVPFPRVNDKNQFGEFMATQIKIGLTRWAGVVAAGAVGVAMFNRLLW
jgi:hypothetical protein